MGNSLKAQLYYTLEIKDKYGTVLKRICRKSHSMVIAWIDILYIQANPATSINTPDITNTPIGLAANASAFCMSGGASDLTRGIVVGTGNTAVAMTDYELAALIADGDNAGQLEYATNTFTAPHTIGTSRYFTISRVMSNLSGGAIAVAEIGLHLLYSGPYTFLGVRDVLPSAQSVGNGKTITITYTYKITV